MPVDSFGRRVDYLRLSVTDRCNLRCRYCLPETIVPHSPSGELMTDDEIVGIAGCFVALGWRRLRLTGGEPLLRPGLVELTRRLAALRGIEDVSLSTNGTLLAAAAKDLAAAGLRRVNISLDTLDAERFSRIARFGALADVLGGIDAALKAGLSPVKINVVVARGMNEDEIGAFARLAEERPVHVRFIELMPMGETGFFSAERLVPLAEILERAAPLEPLPRDAWPEGGGPARYYRRPRGLGTVGVISAMTCTFCAECNRVRLSARGTLVPCLDGDDGVSLRDAWRSGAGVPAIEALIRQTLARKPERHALLERAASGEHNPRLMRHIGG